MTAEVIEIASTFFGFCVAAATAAVSAAHVPQAVRVVCIFGLIFYPIAVAIRIKLIEHTDLARKVLLLHVCA